MVLPGKFYKGGYIVRFNIDVLGQSCGAGITGSGIYFRFALTLRKLPDDGVLPASRTDNQDFQFSLQ
jgi:hypothetical protein